MKRQIAENKAERLKVQEMVAKLKPELKFMRNLNLEMGSFFHRQKKPDLVNRQI